MKYPLIVSLALLAASPAAAQEWQVAREDFAFAGSRLAIRVDTDSPGTLRLIRGGPGSVHVASRAPAGFTAAGLTADEELTLTTAGPGPVEYVVAVPDEVWIDVRIPGSPGRSVGAHTPSESFAWGTAATAATAATATPSPLHPLGGPVRHTALTRDAAPEVVQVPELANIRSLSVRIEGDRFRVLTERPMHVDPGSDGGSLVIRPAPPAMDVILVLPAETRRFSLESGHATALVIDGDVVTALCSPLTDQRLSNGRRWVTFNPVDGSLRCSRPPSTRHEG